MFGYVTVDKPNILIKDFQTYRSYYCGLCMAIKKQSGHLMRLTLNYDIVLLALLAHNYEDAEPEFFEGRCFLHPLGKKKSIVKTNAILRKIADLNTVLGYYKVSDDVIDEGRHRLIRQGMKGVYKKAAKRETAFAERIRVGYERLREEERKGSSAEILSNRFGEMLMSAADAVTEKADKDLREFLYYLGKWIYIVDAIDDLGKDFEKKRFNPYLRNVTEYSDTVIDESVGNARILLYAAIDRIIEAYDRMKITISEGALSNIVYRGVGARSESVLKKRGKECRKIRL